MARSKKGRKKKSRNGIATKTRQFMGVALTLLALLFLIAILSHSSLDDRRISGEIDAHLNPFKIQYRNQAGMVGAYLAFLCTVLMGWLSIFIPLGLLWVALKGLLGKTAHRWRLNLSVLFLGAVLGTMIYNIHLLTTRTLGVDIDTAGGFLGRQLTALSITLVGELGSYVILGGVILLLLIFYTSLSGLLGVRVPWPRTGFLKKSLSAVAAATTRLVSLVRDRSGGDTSVADEQETSESGFETELQGQIEADQSSDTTLRGADAESHGDMWPEASATVDVDEVKTPPSEPLQLGSIEYDYPTKALLTSNPHSGQSVTGDELEFTARILKETLETFNVRIDGTIARFPGPVITRYEFKPASGIKVNQIIGLSDDLALSLKAKRIRIIAPIPGKAAVGIEIPNRKAQIVYLRDILESEQYTGSDYRLPLALGKTTAGRPFVADLSKLPHLLIAGATGSGKSVCINILVTSLLYRLHPHQVRFIMIDPKMLELTAYAGIPFLGRPVVTNPKRAEKVLADAVVEMESRYKKLAAASVRNIEDYNKRQESPEKQLPYIIIMVDELADLLMSANSSKTELLITRLAQMARAVGIHLVLATQRPSVDVITGLIKANFPARIAFQVSSKVDSRTIIDANGAEKLLGLGDMLFMYPGQPEPIRLHGAYITSEETEAIVKHIKAQDLPMMTLENISQATGETTEADVDFGDPLFREACDVVLRHKQGSVSLLQRRLGIGYQRAARLIDKLDQAGIVSPFDGSKARDVLVDRAYVDALFNNATPVSTSDQEAN